jgi:hypothetical protein
MSGIINSFDEVVANSVSDRPRSDLSWYGKAEIGANNEVNVQVLLYFPSSSRPPGEMIIFKRDSSSTLFFLTILAAPGWKRRATNLQSISEPFRIRTPDLAS